MICTADEIVLPGLIEIAVEIFVNHCIALCSLDDDECYGVLVHIGITQFLPVNVLLVVADVYAADMVIVFFGHLLEHAVHDQRRTKVEHIDNAQITFHERLEFVFVGFDDDMDIDNCQTLASEDVDALAKEKLTEEEYARWQELNSQIEASGGGEISDDLINEMTELMIKFTDSDAKWHGCCYTVNADESSLDFDGSITVSDEN